MPILTAILADTLKWAGERLLDSGVAHIKGRLSDNAAKSELLEITGRALEDAIAIAPSLAEDLRSASFLHGVIWPTALNDIADPAVMVDAVKLADGYVARFVEPWVRDGDERKTLARVFQTDRATVVDALEAFVASLRKGLFKSKHWKEVGRDRTIEETREGVAYLVQTQKRMERSIEIDLDVAKADARTGSQDLLDWQRTISGLFIARSELDLLANRIRTEPRGRTLLVGEAGSGKSALLSELTERLQEQGMTVFGLKADMLPADVLSTSDISRALGLRGDLEDELHLLAQAGPVVLVIDQLDAVSGVMDRSSQRMKLLLRIANAFRKDRRFEDGPPVHVLVSSRPFEAAHDARFQSLRAETIKLNLPSNESVQALLAELGIESATVPEGLKETLRRPFALRLFVDMVQRGFDVSAVTGADLLNDWLRSADLGDDAMRPRVIAFFERLAGAMTETETLWRPADTFEADDAAAVRTGEAAGLIIRQDGRLGFSHQSWLDDFQAKGFNTGQDIATFAWDRQDGLFARATILRALERLRRWDPSAYETALDLLLADGRTRRHVRHLVVDLLASQDKPLSRELAWVQRLLRSDVPLARRAVSKLWTRWVAWRSALKPHLPSIMASPELKWTAIQMLQAEAALDPNEAIALLKSEWPTPEADLDVLEVARRGPLWGPWISNRVSEILDRHDIQDFAIANFIEEFIKVGRPADGVELLTLYLGVKAVGSRQRFRLYGLGTLLEAAPIDLAKALTPWFIDLISEADAGPSFRSQFPEARSLPFDWDDDSNEDSIYHALRAALEKCVTIDPVAADALLASLAKVEVDEAQALVARTYAAKPEHFADTAAGFLLADPRRFAVGTAHLQDERGVHQSVGGHATKELLTAIGPHLPQDRLLQIKQAINGWDRYRDEVWENSTAKDRLMMLGWTRDARQALLTCLPMTVFDAREARQISEWSAGQPILTKGSGMAHCVGAPMSTSQMEKAADDDLMGLLNDCPDGSDWGGRFNKRRHISVSGGAVQVGQAFGALGKTDSARIMRLIRERLSPERHQYAAGTAIHEISSLEGVDADELTRLIHETAARGFDGEDWRRNAAWALQNIARRNNGLQAADLDLLESWIVDDAQLATDRIARRHKNEQENIERNAHLRENDRKTAAAVIFGHGGRGFGVLPQDNYAYLSAMAAGFLNREPTDCDGWLAVLERHVERADDPAIWAAILTYDARHLYWADRARTLAFFEVVWERFPEAFTLVVGQALWSYRAMIPPRVQTAFLEAWASSSDPDLAQGVGEFTVAAELVDGNTDILAPMATDIMNGPASTKRLGGLFAMASAWRHNAGGLRDRAHDTLVRFAPLVAGDEAEAISTALDGDRILLPDAATDQLLRIAVDNDALLSAALNSRFADALQELLLHPGFEDVVLAVAEKGTDKLIADRNDGRGRGMIDGDFVAMAIALQRAPGAQRSRAMDLYERLLDAEVYGASEAAAATLRP